MNGAKNKPQGASNLMIALAAITVAVVSGLTIAVFIDSVFTPSQMSKATAYLLVLGGGASIGVIFLRAFPICTGDGDGDAEGGRSHESRRSD